MNKTNKLEFLALISLCVAMFTAFPIIGIGLTMFTFAISIISGNRVAYKSEDFFALTYLVITTFCYAYIYYVSRNLGILSDYVTIVIFPIAMLFAASSITTSSLTIVKFLLGIVFIFSILSFFRDVNGNFTFSLSQNIYMHQRQTDKDLFIEPSLFFRNATLVSIWLVTSFIISSSLYNYTKNKFYLLILLISFAMVFLSNTRTALGICIIIQIINLILNKQKTLLLLLCISVPVLFLLVLSLGSFYQLQVDRFYQLFDSSSSYGLGDRTDFWNYTIDLIERNIWGYGHLYVIKRLGFSTHNEYLGQAVSVGLLAAGVYFIFIFVSFFKRYVSLKRYGNASIWNEITFYLLIVYLVNGLTEQISTGNRYWMALLFMCLGWSKIEYQQIKFRYAPTPTETSIPI